MTQQPAAGYTPGKLTTHNQPGELRAVTRALRASGRRIALVPTLGALHAGHRELIKRARRVPNTVTVVSIFVNSLQFGPSEDHDRYPRPLADDLAVCANHGVELAFTPAESDMYQEGADITVQPGRLGDELEGATRKGHFAGVLTVVAKLLHIVGPDFAFFGEKDYQQLVLVRRMVDELNFDVGIVPVPIVRDTDGLALSSRNIFLTEGQRSAAVTLSAALAAGTAEARGGGNADAVLAATHAVLATQPEVELDYLELRDPGLGEFPGHGEARLLVAAKVGTTRLIDNTTVLLDPR